MKRTEQSAREERARTDAPAQEKRARTDAPAREGQARTDAPAQAGGCCGARRTLRTEEQRRKLIHRLNRIEGQIRGIRGMIERDAYCNDILIQSAAVNAAVSAFNRSLLESHLHACVAEDIRNGHDETIDELMETLSRLIK